MGSSLKPFLALKPFTALEPFTALKPFLALKQGDYFLHFLPKAPPRKKGILGGIFGGLWDDVFNSRYLNPLWLIWTKRIYIKISAFVLKSLYVKCGLKCFRFLSNIKIENN